jgi:CrcB protein
MRFRLDLWGAIALGGAAGTLARAGLAEAWPVRAGAWPWATFAANVGGTLLLGVVAGLTRRRPSLLAPLVGTGFCGALTTFSTFQVEAIRLARADALALALAYVVASLVVGLATVAVALRLAERVRT